MDPTNPINDLLALIPVQYAGYLTAVIAACNLLTAFVLKAPTDASPWWYRAVYAVVNTLALNVKNARNASVLQLALERSVLK